MAPSARQPPPQVRLLAAYCLRCVRATRRASRLICASWAISTRTPKKQIHITAMLGAHVIVPVIARPPNVSKTPARPTATTECLIAFLRSPATSLPGTPLGKRSSFPSSACMRNPIPMNPTPAPANRPPILLLHPPASEIAKYPCETTMATPPPVRSTEPTIQNLTCSTKKLHTDPSPRSTRSGVLAFHLVYVDSETCDGDYRSPNGNDWRRYDHAGNGKRSTTKREDTSKHITPDALACRINVADRAFACVRVQVAVLRVGEQLVGVLLGERAEGGVVVALAELGQGRWPGRRRRQCSG